MGFRRRVALVLLEKAAEKREFDLLPIKFRGLGAEINVSKLVAISAAPAAVCPGSHDEDVGDSGIHPFRIAIDFKRPKEILGIVPAPYSHYGAVNIFQVRANVSCLPIGVVSRVRKKLIPFGGPAFQEELVRIGERTHAQEKIVSIRCFEIERFVLLVQRVLKLLSEEIKESE